MSDFFCYFCIMIDYSRRHTLSILHKFTSLTAFASAIAVILVWAIPASARQQISVTTPAHSEAAYEKFRRSLSELSTDSLFRKGTGYLEQSPMVTDSAMLCYMTAHNRLNEAKDDKIQLKAIASSLINTAHIYSVVYNDFATAYSYLKQAEKICIENDFKRNLAFVYLNMGVTRSNSHLLNTSERPDTSPDEKDSFYIRKAFDIATSIKAYDVMAYSLFNYVDACTDMEDPEMLKYVKRYLTADIPDTEPTKRYMTRMAKGILALNARDFDKALEHFASMDTITMPFPHVTFRMREEGKFLCAMAYECMGRQEKTLTILLNMKKSAIAEGDVNCELWVTGNLYLFSQRVGDDTATDKWLLDYYKIKEHIATMGSNETTITELDLKQTISDYESSIKMAAIRERHDRILLIGGGIVSACVIMTLLIFLFHSRKRRGYITALYKKHLQLAASSQPANNSPRHEGDYSPTVLSTTVNQTPGHVSEAYEDYSQKETVNVDITDPDLIMRISKTLSSDPDIFNSDYQMARLCEKVGSNYTYVSRAINSHYGKSFKAVLAELRIKEACRRLDDPEVNSMYTIESICSEVGFRSRAAFSVAFKNVTGLTPTEYRKAARRYMPT